ncbi:sensor histidine kinase [Chryseosolibacter indicus]|uniref:histidine kinase n=1 Tax=Chryseosolibacter indicus TaxID=2782351 RepID=A0ABS5VQ88_9BACT|nr:ATP-binding protein [Chryseosolibacter indicus]MBT1703603.1 HAMP domain-containing protein [Chryseosolibacter indicus]
MKIRQRLALRFTIVSALITGAILIFIYILTRGFVHADFVERLTQHSSLEALHYASPQTREVIPAESFMLVNPVTSIYDEHGNLLYHQGDYSILKSWVIFLQQNDVFNAERGVYTTVGRKYRINGVQYLVFVSDKDLPGQHELDLLINAMLVGWFVSLFFSYFAGLYFSGNALRPVKRVVQEVNQITKDNLSYRLKLGKDATEVDEIDELILTFNALLTRIESAFITQKRFVQHASHELKTPLTAIMAESELALTRERSREEYKRTLEVITHETERLVTITQGLLTLARLEEGSVKIQMHQLNIKGVMKETLATFSLHHPQRSVEITDSIPDAFVTGDLQLLQIAILNILDNAVKYSKDKITVSVLKTSDLISLSFIDYGVGIPEADLSRIRSPLFRASNVRDVPGAGLGLSLVERIVKVHNGELRLTSEVNKGTTCEIVLPLTSDSQ